MLFFVGSAIGSDTYNLRLTAGLLSWVAGIRWLAKLKPARDAQQAAAAAARRASNSAHDA